MVDNFCDVSDIFSDIGFNSDSDSEDFVIYQLTADFASIYLKTKMKDHPASLGVMCG
jgi:hypothetical protein